MTPQCKNRAEVLKQASRCLEQFGDEAVCKVSGLGFKLVSSLLFCEPPAWYEFPLAKIEDKWVWRGDELFIWPSGMKVAAFDYAESKMNLKVLYPETTYIKETQQTFPCGQLSWNPPTPPKRTVLVNGEEMPLPTAGKDANYGFTLEFQGYHTYWFASLSDVEKWDTKIKSLMDGKP